MNIKKTLTLCTAAALALTMAACGNTKPESETGTGPSQSQTTPSKPQETKPNSDKPNADTPESSDSATSPSEDDKSVSLVDDGNCSVIITSVDADGKLGYTLNVYLENKTDKELMYTVDEVSVNGYMVDPFWAATVSAGKKANEAITFSDADFEKNGITEVTEISFRLKVYDNADWTADHLISETFTIEL